MSASVSTLIKRKGFLELRVRVVHSYAWGPWDRMWGSVQQQGEGGERRVMPRTGQPRPCERPHQRRVRWRCPWAGCGPGRPHPRACAGASLLPGWLVSMSSDLSRPAATPLLNVLLQRPHLLCEGLPISHGRRLDPGWRYVFFSEWNVWKCFQCAPVA